jgi:predicted nucleic acid-binding protein
MIFVDTSVWVEANRRPGHEEASTLRGLLAAGEVAMALPVRIELLSGISKKQRRAFRTAMSALPVAFPTDETWYQLDEWTAHAADAGHHFSVPDLLTAALASERNALVWSLDGDFAAMEKLGLVRCY